MSCMDNREKGYTLFKKGLKYREIAEKLGVPESTVKSWATRYWKNEKVASKKVATKKEKVATEDATGKKKNRGGAPKGNVNAVGKTTGAPPGNKYAEKHGGYSRITLASLSEEEAEFLEEVGATDDEEAMLEHEIKLLTIRIARLMKQISADKYSKGLYVDSVETSETKRRFRTPEDEAEYYRLVQDEIDEGKRKPGEQYKVYTHTKNADDFILSVHEAINRAQALRQRCLDSLAKLREEKRANNPTTGIEDLLDLREAVFGVQEK